MCTVPAVWGTVTIEPSISSQPTEGYEYTYLCSIVLRDGIVGTANLVWVGPDGDPVVTGSNMTVGRAKTVGRKTSLLLSFLPLNSTHGGNYSCNVSVFILHVNVTVSEVVRKTLIITCKSYIQFVQTTFGIMFFSIHLSMHVNESELPVLIVATMCGLTTWHTFTISTSLMIMQGEYSSLTLLYIIFRKHHSNCHEVVFVVLSLL